MLAWDGREVWRAGGGVGDGVGVARVTGGSLEGSLLCVDAVVECGYLGRPHSRVATECRGVAGNSDRVSIRSELSERLQR